MAKSFYVYELWDPFINEPFYVGKGTKESRRSRYDAHLKGALKSQGDKYENKSHKDFRIRKIVRLGKTPIIKIVFNCSEEDTAFNKEKELIKKYGRRDKKLGPLTNHTDGGEGLSGHVASKKERQKKSAAHKGLKNHMFGKRHSQETIDKIRIKKLARKVIYRHTESWKQKLKKSSLILDAKKRALPIYQINFMGEVVKKWPSANAAAESMGLSNSNFYICTKMHHRTLFNSYWIYVKDAVLEGGKLKNIKELNDKRLAPHMSKSINQLNLKGDFIKTWPSYLSVQKELGLNYCVLSNIIRKKRKTNVYGGFLWVSATKE